jgi:hypothetical protein
MILLSEIVSEIKNDLNSGMNYNDSRWDDEYIEAKIHNARATLIGQYMMKLGKFINDSWVQTLDLRFANREKDGNIVTFECPDVISIDGQSDGFVYVGHVNGFKPFLRIRKGYSTLTRHSLFARKKDIMWDYKHMEQNKALLYFYNNNDLTYITVRALFNNPTQIPNFDKEVDHYPVDANLKREIIELVTADLMRKTQRPVEITNTSQTEIPR